MVTLVPDGALFVLLCAYSFVQGINLSLLCPAVGEIVGQTGLFSFAIANGLEEAKLTPAKFTPAVLSSRNDFV